MDSIKERLGAYLARTGKSKTEVAGNLGMSRSTFFQKIGGQSDFTLTEARKLAVMLNCTIDELFVSPFASN